jgi:hypothetical protein
MPVMKKPLSIVVLLLLMTATAFSQPERIGAGLAFATKKRFNGGDTGNPGLNLRTWIPVDKGKYFHIVPSVSAYNPLQTRPNPAWIVTTYMFQGDLDVQYKFFQEKTLKLAAIAGLNYTYISTSNELLISVPANQSPVDSTLTGFGPNLGVALEMRMGPFWDFILSGRYKFTGLRAGDPAFNESFLVADLGAPVIQVHAVYYFTSRGRGYTRR